MDFPQRFRARCLLSGGTCFPELEKAELYQKSMNIETQCILIDAILASLPWCEQS